jgi:multicomponent Na+:H+ antiporter subunit F
MIGLGEHSEVLNWAIDITAALILLGLVCAFVRLVKGPTLPDRVVSVGVITVLAVAIAGLRAVASADRPSIDVAFALALVAFLATVAFAWYADQRTDQIPERDRSRRSEEAH